MNRLLGEAMSAGWTEGLGTWLGTAETDAETIEVNGVTHRYKLDSEKEFLTPGGIVKLTRRVYQPDAGGKCYVPLDAAWGMQGQFATVEVRDAALYAVALGTPREAETLLAKCALFQPSATAIKRMAQQMGEWRLSTYKANRGRSSAESWTATKPGWKTCVSLTPSCGKRPLPRRRSTWPTSCAPP